jgi:hypothetical protein
VSAAKVRPQVIEVARQMRAEGRTLAEIGRAVGLHLSTVQKLITPPEQRRPYTRHERRVTLNVAQESKRAQQQAAFEVSLDEHPHAGYGRPTWYGECVARGLGAETPCPYVSCARHAALDVDDAGTIRLAWPDGEGGIDIDAMPVTCTLRAADDGPATLDEVGAVLGITRERTRQIEAHALAALDETLRGQGVRAIDDVLPGVAWCGAHEVTP